MSIISELHYRILVVVKDPESKAVLQKILKSEGFEFKVVTTGETAFKKTKTEHFDLIVSDIDFGSGKMSGLDLLQEIRAENSAVPFIVISDPNSISSSLKAINYGVSAYLVKPIKEEEAKEAIKKAIRHHKSRFLKNELVNYRMENSFQAVISCGEQSILKLLDTVDNLIDLVYPKEYGSFPDLKMAIYEALSNAAEHGNKKQTEKKIYFKIELKMDRIRVQIKDEGEGFDPLSISRQKAESQNIQRGLNLIDYLMDEVVFNIKGNEINLLKILG